MTTSRILAAVFGGILLTSAAAVAGSPDRPGQGGQHLKTVDLGTAKLVGLTLPEFFEAIGTEKNEIGAHVQAAKEFDGGAPNPANDNGAGND